ncbi:MAG: Maf family protein [Mariprofundaceae bacterium]
MEVILASASPRRLELLQAAGLAVEVRPSRIDETARQGESAKVQVMRLSQAKASACTENNVPVIAADTLVALNDKVFGQPESLVVARRMLAQLSGQTHSVYTGVCVRLGEASTSEIVRTDVRFRTISAEEIATYLAHNDVLDKAGAYAVQAGAASFIEAVDGPLDNVIGLPVQHTLKLLNHLVADQPNFMRTAA